MSRGSVLNTSHMRVGCISEVWAFFLPRNDMYYTHVHICTTYIHSMPALQVHVYTCISDSSACKNILLLRVKSVYQTDFIVFHLSTDPAGSRLSSPLVGRSRELPDALPNEWDSSNLYLTRILMDLWFLISLTILSCQWRRKMIFYRGAPSSRPALCECARNYSIPASRSVTVGTWERG